MVKEFVPVGPPCAIENWPPHRTVILHMVRQWAENSGYWTSWFLSLICGMWWVVLRPIIELQVMIIFELFRGH